MGVAGTSRIKIIKRTTPSGKVFSIEPEIKISPPKENQKISNYTAKDIKSLETFKGFNGWTWGGHGYGYLGASTRNSWSDKYLAEAGNELGLDLEELFLWANSKPGRHFMDNYPTNFYDYRRGHWSEMHSSEERRYAFLVALEHDMPELIAETGYRKS